MPDTVPGAQNTSGTKREALEVKMGQASPAPEAPQRAEHLAELSGCQEKTFCSKKLSLERRCRERSFG